MTPHRTATYTPSRPLAPADALGPDAGWRPTLLAMAHEAGFGCGFGLEGLLDRIEHRTDPRSIGQ